MRFRLARPGRRIALPLLIIGGWALVALVQALHGYLIARHQGQMQLWWPTLGYALAIHSVWALLTTPIVIFARAAERHVARWWVRIPLYVAAWPVVAALQVLLFGLIYWPVYRGPHAATRWEMADLMFARNLGTNGLLYGAVVGMAVAWLRWPRRQAGEDSPPRSDAALLIRNRGRVARIPHDAIDWIGAAGDYAEIHAGGRAHLIDESLASLANRLPEGDFARIHRGALVRLDRIREIVPVGRGDARVRLATGEELRLSRRFRANLARLLGSARPAD